MENKNTKELEALAGNGDVGAIYELGQRYFSGIGVEQNVQKAREYFEVAVERGATGANYFLGKIYYNGIGVETDHTKAKEYFEKSAARNNAFSEYYLGKIYFWGDGVEKDYDKANEYKTSVLNRPLYANQDTGIEEFYSIADFEAQTRQYVGELQNKVLVEYKKLFGND